MKRMKSSGADPRQWGAVIGLCAWFGASGVASAQTGPSWHDDGTTVVTEKDISESQRLEFACKQAPFWQAEVKRADAAAQNKEPLCALEDAGERKALSDASALLVSACAPVDETAKALQDKLTREAQQALSEAQSSLAAAEERARLATLAHAEWKEIVLRPGHKATPEDLEKLRVKKDAADRAADEVTAARQLVTDKKKAEDTALLQKQASDQATAEVLAKKQLAAGTFAKALSAALDRPSRSPADFEAKVDNPTWTRACDGLRERQKNAGLLVDREQEATKAAEQARGEDLLRKASSHPSVLGGGNGLIETSGAPDRVIYSLFSALGADQKTNGTQVVMTLNLGQLWPSRTPRVEQHAWVRNLFVRAAVPLTATEAVPVGGPTETASGADPTNVSRMSFVIGTSLADDSDPRVTANRPCYLSALSYVPFSPTVPGEQNAAAEERKDYFDICNRRAANRQRLALRGGIGLVIEGDDAEKTRVEYLSGAMVWAPRSWVTVNAIYQRLLLPFERHHFGAGVSTAWNASTSESGVDAWVRLGLDLLVLGTFDDATKKTDIETRIALALRFKLPQSSIVTLGIGPRLVGSAIEEPGVLATVGLTYDADLLLEPLMSGPPPAKP